MLVFLSVSECTLVFQIISESLWVWRSISECKVYFLVFLHEIYVSVLWVYMFVWVKNCASIFLCIWVFRGKKALKGLDTSESTITKMLLKNEFHSSLGLSITWQTDQTNNESPNHLRIYHLTATWRVFTGFFWS